LSKIYCINDSDADKLMVVGFKAMLSYDTDERRKYLKTEASPAPRRLSTSNQSSNVSRRSWTGQNALHDGSGLPALR
jgi:hypothetical protein